MKDAASRIANRLVKAAPIDREQHGGVWGEHPAHPVSDWQYEVANGDTRLGYWEWAAHRGEEGIA